MPDLGPGGTHGQPPGVSEEPAIGICPPARLPGDGVWLLTLGGASRGCGGCSGLCANRRPRRPVGRRGACRCWRTDRLTGKGKIRVWRADCPFQMGPWGRAGVDPGKPAQENPQAASYVHRAMLRRGQQELRHYSSWRFGSHSSIFVLPLPICGTSPGTTWVHLAPPPHQVSAHLLGSEMCLKVQTNWLHDTISVNFPPTPQASSFQ